MTVNMDNILKKNGKSSILNIEFALSVKAESSG